MAALAAVWNWTVGNKIKMALAAGVVLVLLSLWAFARAWFAAEITAAEARGAAACVTAANEATVAAQGDALDDANKRIKALTKQLNDALAAGAEQARREAAYAATVKEAQNRLKEKEQADATLEDFGDQLLPADYLIGLRRGAGQGTDSIGGDPDGQD